MAKKKAKLSKAAATKQLERMQKESEIDAWAAEYYDCGLSMLDPASASNPICDQLDAMIAALEAQIAGYEAVKAGFGCP